MNPLHHRRTQEFALSSHDDDNAFAASLSKALSAAAVSLAVWGAPALELLPPSHPIEHQQQHLLAPSFTASAKEMASGSGSRVNKDPESLLRLGLPIQNKEVRSNCVR